jgi:regulator of sigma D
MITGYLEKDSHILDFLDIYKEKDGRERKKYVIKNREMIEKGKELENKFALDDEEIENIFDILEGEHPEL